MNILIVMPMLLMPMTAFAQERYGMNDSETQRMMVEMQKLQDCMASIDQSQFGEIEQRQQQFEKEVRPLCVSGKRDDAQKRAIKFGKEMANHPAIREISKCGKLVSSDMAIEVLPETDFNFEEPNTHVCDEMLQSSEDS
jgi:hypothetical protein